jgi:hypothetical protein
MIKPSDCLSVQDQATLKELEAKVDDYLRNKYDGSRELCLSHIVNLSEGKLRREICKRYRDAGWYVYFKPCSMGGMAANGPFFHTEDRVEIARGVQQGDR